MTWSKGPEDERLVARACGLVFLITKLGAGNTEIGIKANVDTLADLLVEDISNGSSGLRSRLPSLLDKCELLMKVGDEYRIQTEESAAWNDDFLSRRSDLANQPHQIEAEREDQIKARFGEAVKKLSLQQGVSKVNRNLHPVLDAQLPSDSGKKICLWVRNGWSIDENSVRADARQAGNQSPTVFIFIPKRSADDLRRNIINYKASKSTLEARGVSNTPEGIEARGAMETTFRDATNKISEYLDEAFEEAKVFQGGGNEISGNNLQEAVLEGAENSLLRLYPQFQVADNPGWSKVYEKAQKGAPDALKSIGYEGEPANNPVCKLILASIAGGKKGAEIRSQFEDSPYGWPGDAVDGGLQVLLVAGLTRAQDERGKTLDPKSLERKLIGKTLFKVEATTVTTPQRIQIRKVLQKSGLVLNQGEELLRVPTFIDKMLGLAGRAGGEPPKPVKPDTVMIEEIHLSAGNEQLLSIYNKREELARAIDNWTDQAARIDKRWPEWITVKKLMSHSGPLPDADVFRARIETIEKQRQLLEEPDPLAPISANLTQLLRDELNRLDKEYGFQHEKGMERLRMDANWKQLGPDEKLQLMTSQNLHNSARPDIRVQSTSEVLTTLEKHSLHFLKDRVAAMPARFGNVVVEAAELIEPELQLVDLPHRTFKTVEDIDSWLQDLRAKLTAALMKGPVIIK
jgi:hypothetical protein